MLHHWPILILRCRATFHGVPAAPPHLCRHPDPLLHQHGRFDETGVDDTAVDRPAEHVHLHPQALAHGLHGEFGGHVRGQQRRAWRARPSAGPREYKPRAVTGRHVSRRGLDQWQEGLHHSQVSDVVDVVLSLVHGDRHVLRGTVERHPVEIDDGGEADGGRLRHAQFRRRGGVPHGFIGRDVQGHDHNFLERLLVPSEQLCKLFFSSRGIVGTGKYTVMVRSLRTRG
mmetsp:Transcript_541/g.1274  ORF Transcript_541/g.1274 Transcript_541/m.1274 type:complete len:228 (-) Transcript_541:395-1078(-)